jgi:phospholipase C
MRALRQRKWPAAIALAAMLCAQSAAPLVYADQKNHNDGSTATPIKHLIVLIGENRSFDNAFGTYRPKGDEGGDDHFAAVANLLSRGIVNDDGSPGPNRSLALQNSVNTLPATYFITVPSKDKTPYSPLPPPHASGAPNVQLPLGSTAPFNSTVSDAELQLLEPSLEIDDLGLLRAGATGLSATSGVVDTRVADATNMPNTSFQITGPNLPYDSYTGDTVHRFYHMWQQSDCDAARVSTTNPNGCLNDLYPFVGIARDDSSGNSMGFYNVQDGDVPVLKRLADEYTLSDNFHQSVMGGTAANHMALGTGDAIFWTTFGGMTTPPASQIADPDPKTPTSDAYKNDKAWTDCGDSTQPGVKPILDYLSNLPYHPSPNCQNVFYMVNNLSPGFLPNGNVDAASITAGTKVPPSALRTIGDELNDKSISWAYYGGGYDAAVRVANGSTDPTDKAIAANYCDICNFESYASSIMGKPAQRAAHIKDATDFFADLQAGTLPAVSFVKPDSFVDGHPASSKLDLFEGMLENIVDQLNGQKDTALFVAFDEGGGYWDSGYYQPLDFFGDGPRIPFIVVSAYAKHGQVVHTYYDHVSILKFIERNWGLAPLTGRSRDNLPNPVTASGNPYVPVNSPAIGDLMDMFDFHSED